MVKAEELRRTGKKIIPLNIGDPVKYGFDTPPHIKRALERAVQEGSNYYAPSEGLKELREAVAENANSINEAHIDSDNVQITSGISEAILLLMAAIVNPGDEVLMPGPCYPPYIAYTKFFEGNPVTYRTVEARGWAPDLSDLEKKITGRTRLIVMINPSNPTGSVYSKEAIVKILELAATHDIPLAADEIYGQIVYDAKFSSAASLAKDVPLIGLNGFSKAYLMTGWRLGYLYRQDPLGKLTDVWDGILRLARVRLCASTPAQVAAVEALRGPQDHIREMVTTLRRRRDLSLKRVNGIVGLSATKPEGAFYLFPKIDGIGSRWKSDEAFVSELLRETGVLVVHGSGFDPTYGKDHFRAVFLPEESMLNEGFSAIDDFIKRHA